jgi:predicted anti-sigma-YlaC factor YlaD
VRTSCDRARERLSLQLDDELSPHETLLLERHLVRCPVCADFAAAARSCTELLRSAPLEAAPPLMLPRRLGARRFQVRAGAAVASVAAAALVAVSTLGLSQQSASSRPVLFGFSPRGLAVNQSNEPTLGVQRAASAKPSAGPRRGQLVL